MSMIDHLSLGVNDIPCAGEFYDGLMALLGSQPLAQTTQFIAYGRDKVEFLIMRPADGQAANHGNGTHIAFAAASTDTVDQFHAFAMANGGACEGAPGPRESYPLPDVYCAYVRDPFGNKLEIIHNGFSA